MRIHFSALLFVLLAGCASVPPAPPMSPEESARVAAQWEAASKVRVSVNPELVRGCEYVGRIMRRWVESLPVDPLGRHAGDDDTRVIRFKAAGMGANAVLQVSTELPADVREKADEFNRLNSLDMRKYEIMKELESREWLAGEAYRCQ